MVKTTRELTMRQQTRRRRHRRVRRKVEGTPERPRLTVFRSNRNIFAQAIDDLAGRTLASASSIEIGQNGINKTEQAEKVGELLAGRARENNIEQVVFDRGSYLYHGRVKALAEGARKGGMKF